MRSRTRALLQLALLGALLASLAAVGCARHRGRYDEGRFHSPRVAYQVGTLPEGWELGETPPADVAFHHPGLGATIYADSSCRRYSDASLHILSNHLFFGFDDIDVLRQVIMEVDEREAMQRISDARLDGVLFRIGTTVIKKNECIFDLVLMAPRELFGSAWPEYQAFVEAFHLESSR